MADITRDAITNKVRYARNLSWIWLTIACIALAIGGAAIWSGVALIVSSVWQATAFILEAGRIEVRD